MLNNKLGIDNSAELAREGERISKKKAIELFEKGMLNDKKAGKPIFIGAICAKFVYMCEKRKH